MANTPAYCPKCQDNYSRGKGPEGQILLCHDCYEQETKKEVGDDEVEQ